jgi:hypothetical protein
MRLIVLIAQNEYLALFMVKYGNIRGVKPMQTKVYTRPYAHEDDGGRVTPPFPAANFFGRTFLERQMAARGEKRKRLSV